MRFFFDRNMSPRLARMVDIFDLENEVRHLDDDERFSRTTPGIDWIRMLASDDAPWIVLSGDGRILRNQAERVALKQANLTFFCMGRPWAHMKIEEYAWLFIQMWPKITENAKVATPKLFEVSMRKVEILRW